MSRKVRPAVLMEEATMVPAEPVGPNWSISGERAKACPI